jgi:5-methyltetrahydropteroyltriglutamate--homocysteine methyltransferase
MMEAYITGIFPRRDTLIDTWKRWERGKAEEEEFREEMEKTQEEVVNIQRVAKLTYIHDPQIDWHDIFRPFTNLENIMAGPITRYFENNTFYKKPIIKDRVRYEEGFIERYIHRDKLPKGYRWTVTLPGPYTFYRLSEAKEEEIKIRSVTEMLKGALNDLKRLGYTLINLHEPALAYYRDIDWSLVKELYREIMETETIYRVQLYFGDISDRLQKLMEIAPDGFSIDMAYTSIKKIENIKFKRVILGIIDAQNTLMEYIDPIVNRIKIYRERTGVEDIAITPNTDLDYLPYEVAKGKLMTLSEILRRLRA